MNIVELELFSEYKKIKSRTKFEFKEKNILEILGENGSGKSILFELLTDILSYSTLDGDEQNKIMKNKELLFRLKLKIKNKLIVIERLTLSESIRSYIENDEQQLPYNINKDLNIIIYSSAKKSILSETYYRLLLKSKDNLNDNRFNFYIREKIKKIIIIYLFIFKENYLKEIFKGIITINPIKKIKIKFNKSNVENMIFFKKIIGREFENISEEELGMILDDNDIQKIREVYQKNDQYFYQILQNLELLNISEALKKERIDNIRDEYISERVEDNYLNNQFSIQDIEFDNDITYRYISEGELQLFETLGAIILFQSREYQKENLYIFDEPTTHLNVNWLTKYITLLKETLKIIPSERVEPVNSQIIFSTHNSDIMIDLPKANLHLIKNGEFKSISEETFGGSELKLNRVYFNKLDSVSENVMREIEKELKKIESETNIKELKKIERRIEVKFANSPEKYNLLRSIEERAFELEENE